MSDVKPSASSETPAQRREKRRTMTIGIIVGGFIGVTLGMIAVSAFRSCTAETHSPPEVPIRLLPPRPANPTPSI